MVKGEQSQTKLKGGRWIVFAGVAIIIVLLIVVVILLTQNQGSGDVVDQSSATRRNVVVNEENISSVAASIESRGFVSPGSYEVTMNSTWRFADGKSTSENAYVENVEWNTNDVYFDVIRSDTEELIYSSPVIPRGSYLDDITLDTELPADTYDCVLIYHLVDEGQNTTATLRLGLTIVIEQ